MVVLFLVVSVCLSVCLPVCSFVNTTTPEQLGDIAKFSWHDPRADKLENGYIGGGVRWQ